MIGAYSRSRHIVYVLGILLGICGGILGWSLSQGKIASLGGRAAVAVLAAFLGVNLAIYAARGVALREYQSQLLYLYEELDPRKFLTALLPLLQAKLDPSLRETLMIHIANGYLYGGDISKALEILDEIETPEKALELRCMVLSNKASCYMMNNKLKAAEEQLSRLRTLIGQESCKEEFAQKTRHAIAYLELCLSIRKGKRVDVCILEKDFSGSRSPLHKLDVQFQMALFYLKQGQKRPYQTARNYVLTFGQKTFLPSMLPES